MNVLQLYIYMYARYLWKGFFNKTKLYKRKQKDIDLEQRGKNIDLKQDRGRNINKFTCRSTR